MRDLSDIHTNTNMLHMRILTQTRTCTCMSTHTCLHLANSDKLTPLILEVESESREMVHSAEEELEGSRCVNVCEGVNV